MMNSSTPRMAIFVFRPRASTANRTMAKPGFHPEAGQVEHDDNAEHRRQQADFDIGAFLAIKRIARLERPHEAGQHLDKAEAEQQAE